MAKIAVELERALAERALSGAPGQAVARTLAQGEGWAVDDVLCTSGSHDRSFEEQHSWFSIAIVAAGTFQYRSSGGCELMAPGMLLLGNAGQAFQCGHEHANGDRCLAFRYAPNYFERLAADAGVRGGRLDFSALRLPCLPAFSSLTARSCSGLLGVPAMPWEEFSIKIAA